uniref:Uncharacterized protein n=1 Tax=Oryza punctata TaxID=4537 RepID=A0A0E0LBS4_ORYPU
MKRRKPQGGVGSEWGAKGEREERSPLLYRVEDTLSLRAIAWDMLRIYNDFIDSEERSRIERLELFDKFEEWHMMQEHYCVAYGINDAKGVFDDFGFKKD